MNFTAFDFETANNSPSSVCSLGIAVVKSDRIVESHHWLIKPVPNEFEYRYHTQIHGIAERDVQDAPTFGELWPRISHYFESQIIVAHNARSADCNMLMNALSIFNLPYPNATVLCTMELAKALFPDESHSLGHLCKKFNIQLAEHHNAEHDAIACATLLCRLNFLHECASPVELCERCGVPSYALSAERLRENKQPRRQCRSNQPLEAPAICNCLQGLRFVFTGQLSVSREEAATAVLLLGGEFSDSVNRKTNFLVCGHAPGKTKLIKAAELQEQGFEIYIIDEDYFWDFLHFSYSEEN